MMKARKLTLAAMTALVFALGSTVSANVLFTFSPGQPTGNATPNEQITIGNEFTIGAVGLDVSHLGAYIVPSLRDVSGKTTLPYVVQLFDKTGADTGTFLGEVTVPVGTPVDAAGFAYIPYAYTLAPNTGYVLTDYGISGGVVQTGYSVSAPGSPGVTSGTFGPAATFVKNRYAGYGVPFAVGSTVFPSENTASYEQFMGGNVLFAWAGEECEYANAVLADAPAAYWRLNEGPERSLAMDYVGNAHFAYQPSIQRGGVEVGPRPSAGLLGFEGTNAAPRLAGTDYLTATGVLPGQNDYTAEMWFRRDAVPSPYGSFLMHRNDLGAPNDSGDYLGIAPPSPGVVSLYVYDGTTVAWGPTDIVEDDWYHLAMVRDDDNVLVYLNGQLEIEQTLSNSVGRVWTDGDWAFGGRLDLFQQIFSGSMDEIAVYGSALSREEIRAHYLVGVPEPSTWLLLTLAGLSLAACRRRKKAL